MTAQRWSGSLAARSTIAPGRQRIGSRSRVTAGDPASPPHRSHFSSGASPWHAMRLNSSPMSGSVTSRPTTRSQRSPPIGGSASARSTGCATAAAGRGAASACARCRRRCAPCRRPRRCWHGRPILAARATSPPFVPAKAGIQFFRRKKVLGPRLRGDERRKECRSIQTQRAPMRQRAKKRRRSSASSGWCERELAAEEAVRAQLGPLARAPADAERCARTLATLTQTLHALARLRSGRAPDTGS